MSPLLVALFGTDPKNLIDRVRFLEGFAGVRVVAHGSVEDAAAIVAREKPLLAIVEPSAVSIDLVVIRGVMVNAALPILVAQRPDQQVDTQRYLAAGALDVLKWPTVGDTDSITRFERRLRTVARVPTVTRHPSRRAATTSSNGPVVAICASTGGPLALVAVLRGLAGLQAPILVIQHIVEGFTDEFVSWLDGLVPQSVQEVRAGESALPGVVYFPPPARHITVDVRRVLHAPDHPEGLHRPSADVLLFSVAESIGDMGVGVILTGMGDDGARGLLALRDRGGVTIVQDEASSVIYGMGRAAAEMGAAQKIVPLEQIAALVVTSVGRILP